MHACKFLLRIHKGYSLQTVSDVRSIASQDTIKLLWRAPRPYSAFVYQVEYTIGNVTAVKRMFDTEFVLDDLPLFTFVLFTIKVEDMGTMGPETVLGQTSGLEINYYTSMFIVVCR